MQCSVGVRLCTRMQLDAQPLMCCISLADGLTAKRHENGVVSRSGWVKKQHVPVTRCAFVCNAKTVQEQVDLGITPQGRTRSKNLTLDMVPCIAGALPTDIETKQTAGYWYYVVVFSKASAPDQDRGLFRLELHGVE